MKKLVLVLGFVCAVTAFAFAQEAKVETPTGDSTGVEVITLKGDIIDNMCAGSQKPEELAEFVKTHTKECALAPSCAASGYSIFADGQLMKFDKESSAKVEEFLKKEDSKLQVSVTANKVGEELSLVSIENQ